MQNRPRIVVVDDEAVLAKLLHQFLEGLGYEVKSFSNSLEATSFLSKSISWPDLILTDFNMPGIDGCNLVKTIKSARPSIPCICFSGDISQTLQETAASLGVQLVSKPVRLMEVQRLVSETLSGPKN